MSVLKTTLANIPDFSTHHISQLEIEYDCSLHDLVTQLPVCLDELEKRPLMRCLLLPGQAIAEDLPGMPYDIVALGGTFDYFHIGHQILLIQALMVARKQIIVGVTGMELLINKKCKQSIQPLNVRMEEVRKYISRIRPDLQISITQINDPFGPTIIRPQIDAIIVSEQTIKGGHKINEIRKQKGFKELAIEVAPIISKQHGSKESTIDQKLSSSHIREYLLIKNRMNEESFNDYHEEWWKMVEGIWNVFGGKGEPGARQAAEKWWSFVLSNYSQYWRAYHTNQHIYSMLKEYRHHFQSLGLLHTPEQQSCLLVSIWFHDLQYNPSQADNEEKSAILASQFVEQILEKEVDQQKVNSFIKEIMYDITATKKHSINQQKETTKVLIDLDMSILNQKWEIYKQYAESIKQEYQPIVGTAYAGKRIDFLKTVKPEETLCFTKDHSQISVNINKEIEMLEEWIKIQGK